MAAKITRRKDCIMPYDQETLELLKAIALERAQAELDALKALDALPANNLSVEEADYYLVRWHDSYSVMGGVLDLRPRMDYNDWLTVLGEAWTGCDNIRKHSAELRRLLGTAGPFLPIMNAEEEAVYNALPARVTVYRGCSARYMGGPSWTLDEGVAKKFTVLARYTIPDPVLVTASVRKQNVLAVLLGREEQAVVTFKARRVSVERLEKNDDDACDG
jgi:hypothetical protein